MSKQPNSPVTASEMAFLQILWSASRPLNKQEILEKANAEEPLFAKNSFHLLANELIAKGYLTPIDKGEKTPGGMPRRFPVMNFWPCKFSPLKPISPQTYRKYLPHF